MDHPKELEVIKKMLNLEKTGFNHAQIATILNSQNLKTKNGAPWQRWTVRKILQEKEKASNSKNMAPSKAPRSFSLLN